MILTQNTLNTQNIIIFLICVNLCAKLSLAAKSHTDHHRFTLIFWFRRQYEQYGQFIDIDKSKLIVNMKNIVLVVRVVFKKRNLSKSVCKNTAWQHSFKSLREKSKKIC